jgi:arylsulfatase A-like enzyme
MSQRNKPHIIYVLSDEHRGQAMRHTGEANLSTPNMDRLAREGVSFARAYANCPICTPSRGSIFSGRHAHCGPVQNFFDVYKATAPSSATLLSAMGYHTAYFGKWHCGIVHDQLPPEVRAHPEEYGGSAQRTPELHRAGFQDWFGFENLNQHFSSYIYCNDDANPTKLNGYETDALTERVVQYLREYARDEPLFLVLSVTPPHFPFLVPGEWQRFDPAQLEVRPNFTDTPENRATLAKYYAMIENLDWNIGRLMNALQELPQFQNTLTVYFSDHGEYLGSHNRVAAKEHPHEESVRIPAIFHWPGHIPARGLTDGLFSIVDMLPTTLGLAGVPIPAHIQGADFSSLLRGQEYSSPETVLLEMQGNPRWCLGLLDWRGLVDERWKYAFYETGEELLYDLEADPYEMNNLAATEPQRVQEMRQRLLNLLKETREPYFDVLIESGAPMAAETLDVSRL